MYIYTRRHTNNTTASQQQHNKQHKNTENIQTKNITFIYLNHVVMVRKDVVSAYWVESVAAVLFSLVRNPMPPHRKRFSEKKWNSNTVNARLGPH